MAVCLKRIFRIRDSLMFIIRRNQQTSCFARNTNGIAFTVSNEIAFWELQNVYCSCNLPKLDNASSKFFTKIININRIINSELIKTNSLINLRPDCFGVNDIVYCAKECKAYKEEDIQKDSNNNGRPEPEQVLYVFKVLSEDLPKLFKKTLNYNIYHSNIIFENNIRGTKTVGIFNYAKQVTLLKAVGHIKFASVFFDVLKITAHPEDGTVRVRWRIRGVPNYRAFFSLLQFFSSSNIQNFEGWYDGFSIFYVRSDGLIHKHTVDKMIPDSDEKVSNIQNNLAAKIAFAVGVEAKDLSSYSKSLKDTQKKSKSKCFQNLNVSLANKNLF